MKLYELPKRKGSKSKSKRVGRGYSSGKGGHTVGLGTKGQKSRGRGKIPLGFEGGQVPLYKKIPKISHFKKRAKKDVKTVSLVSLNRFEDGTEISPESLVERKIIKKLPKHGVKIIANGNLHKKLELTGFIISEGARKKIEKSGSKIIEQ